MTTTICEIVCTQGLLTDLRVKIDGPSELLCDNDAVFKLAANPNFHRRTKHIEVDFYFT